MKDEGKKKREMSGGEQRQHGEEGKGRKGKGKSTPLRRGGLLNPWKRVQRPGHTLRDFNRGPSTRTKSILSGGGGDQEKWTTGKEARST